MFKYPRSAVIGTFVALSACVSNSDGFLSERYVFVKEGMSFSEFMADSKDCRHMASKNNVSGGGYHGDGSLAGALGVLIVSSAMNAHEKGAVDQAERGCMQEQGYRYAALPKDVFTEMNSIKSPTKKRAYFRDFLTTADLTSLEDADDVIARQPKADPNKPEDK